MKIREVISKEDKKEFINVHVTVNSGNPNWVRPLDSEVEDVFDPNKNKLLKRAEAVRFLLEDSGKFIGRIAAYVNPKYTNKNDQQPTGGIGYFDCIADQDAANRLFDAARQWLRERGMEAMDGPINLGERNVRWGLLVKGFQTPVHGLSYNPEYYQALFENYGFKKFYSQYCYDLDIKQDVPHQLVDKFYKAHAKFADDPSYYIKCVTKKNIKEFSRDFSEVYNKAWASHGGNKTISEAVAYKMFLKMKPIIKKHTAWLAYHNDTPVAMWINMIDLNEIFKGFNGKFGWFQKLKFLYLINFKRLTRLVGLIYGIIPEYQGTGIDYFMIAEAEKELKTKTSFDTLELQWIGDFNPKMMAIAKFLDGEQSRELITYRYLFDRNTEFVRHPILG